MPSEHETSSASDLPALIQQASDELDNTCLQRHQRGQEKYGDLTFFDADTVEMAMEEVADMMNYMRYTWIKLWLLRRSIYKIVEKHPAADSEGFIPLKEM
jgi:hypothetical protein